MSMQPITIALAKGRLAELAVELLEVCGLDCQQVRHPERKLVLYDEAGEYRFVLVKPSDVPIYVERGVADIGVVGKDTLMEKNPSLYEMLDLGYGKCRFALAVPQGSDFYGTYQNRVIASKYPNVTKMYFAEKGMDVSVIKIEGSVELAPLVGLSNGIVDIVQTGTTLKENGLVPIETVAPVSARLIVNTASMKLCQQEIFDFIDRIEAQLG